jgi:hypothetical protein
LVDARGQTLRRIYDHDTELAGFDGGLLGNDGTSVRGNPWRLS